MIRQFAATVYIFEPDDQKVLLIFHKKLQKWVPPGGHIEPNEHPHVCAIREAKEETGYDIELIHEEDLWFDLSYAKSYPRPSLCVTFNVPERKNEKAHQHMDLIYLGKPVGGEMIKNEKETEGIKWFSLEEVTQLNIETEICEKALKTIQHYLPKLCDVPQVLA